MLSDCEEGNKSIFKIYFGKKIQRRCFYSFICSFYYYYSSPTDMIHKTLVQSAPHRFCLKLFTLHMERRLSFRSTSKEEDIPFQIVTQFFCFAVLLTWISASFVLLLIPDDCQQSVYESMPLNFLANRNAPWVFNKEEKEVDKHNIQRTAINAINIWKIKGKRMDLEE